MERFEVTLHYLVCVCASKEKCHRWQMRGSTFREFFIVTSSEKDENEIG